MRPARFPGFDHETDLRPQALANQVMMNGRRGQQGRNGDMILVHAAVRKYQDVVAAFDNLLGASAKTRERGLHPFRAVGGGVGDIEGMGAKGVVHVVFDSPNSFQIHIGQNRLPHLQSLVLAARVEIKQIGARADQAHQTHDQFLANGVDRRIGHLGEVLFEVIEKHLRLVGKHRDRRVAPHGTHRVQTRQGHAPQKNPDVFLGVAERLLTIHQNIVVRRHGGDFPRQVFDVDLGFVQPLPIGFGPGEAGFDFLVVDDAAFLQVDQEHLARPQAPLGDDPFFRNVRQDADLRRHHAKVVVGYHIAGRAQAVPVQGRADLAAVGEGDGGGAVPGFHQGGVIFVKSAPVRTHQRIVRPGFRNHHHHRVGKRIAARHQKFERVVESRGVRNVVADQRPELLQIRAQTFGTHVVAAGVHPIHVAAERVDFAVVAQVAERLRQGPTREGVGGEPLMRHGNGGFHALVRQILEIDRQIGPQDHALVADGPGGERNHIEVVATGFARIPQAMMRPLANNEKFALESGFRGGVFPPADEEHLDRRLVGLDRTTKAGIVHRNIPPTQKALTFRGRGFLDRRDRRRANPLVSRQENQTDGIIAKRGQVDAESPALGA